MVESQEFEPIHDWHVQIHEDDIVLVREQHSQTLTAVGCRADLDSPHPVVAAAAAAAPAIWIWPHEQWSYRRLLESAGPLGRVHQQPAPQLSRPGPGSLPGLGPGPGGYVLASGTAPPLQKHLFLVQKQQQTGVCPLHMHLESKRGTPGRASEGPRSEYGIASQKHAPPKTSLVRQSHSPPRASHCALTLARPTLEEIDLTSLLLVCVVLNSSKMDPRAEAGTDSVVMHFHTKHGELIASTGTGYGSSSSSTGNIPSNVLEFISVARCVRRRCTPRVCVRR